MRKYIALLAVMFLVFAVRAFATPRDARYVNEGDTFFQNIGATGNQQTGNPGLLILQGVDGSGNSYTSYFWMGADAKLCTASYATVGGKTSYPSGDWRTGMGCTVVGSQS